MQIIIQRQEDHPHNPGWWRFSRPVLENVQEAPPIRDSVRWRYGNAVECAEEQSQWDAAHPRG